MIIESLMSRKYAVAVLHCFPWNYTIVLLNFYYIIALVLTLLSSLFPMATFELNENKESSTRLRSLSVQYIAVFKSIVTCCRPLMLSCSLCRYIQ